MIERSYMNVITPKHYSSNVALVYMIFGFIYCLGFGIAQAQNFQRYSCLVDRIDPIAWLEIPSRVLNEDQVVITAGNPHPVNICQYGMLCHNMFIETGDTLWRDRMFAQCRWLLDSTNYHLKFEGRGAGLPYFVHYRDMFSPWYSAMAQGYAASLLLRYIEMSGDRSAEVVIRKLVFLMLQPVEEGGCLGRSREGHLWLEEYPGSTQMPEVLNGSINAFIGLWEYCKVFPDDSLANEVRDAFYEGLVDSFEYYDMPNWTHYNRLRNYAARNSYVRYQIFQMRHLYALTKNEAFQKQAMLWAKMISGEAVEKASAPRVYEAYDLAVPSRRIGDSLCPKWTGMLRDSVPMRWLPGSEVREFPWYGFYQSKPMFMAKTETRRINLRAGLPRAIVFHRVAGSEQMLTRVKWSIKNCYPAQGAKITLAQGVHQFLIVYEVDGRDGPDSKGEADQPYSSYLIIPDWMR